MDNGLIKLINGAILTSTLAGCANNAGVTVPENDLSIKSNEKMYTQLCMNYDLSKNADIAKLFKNNPTYSNIKIQNELYENLARQNYVKVCSNTSNNKAYEINKVETLTNPKPTNIIIEDLF